MCVKTDRLVTGLSRSCGNPANKKRSIGASLHHTKHKHGSHHSWQAALHLRVRAVAVVFRVIPGRAGGRVGRAVGAGGHVGADRRELRCDELRKESEFSSTSLDASPHISTVRDRSMY